MIKSLEDLAHRYGLEDDQTLLALIKEGYLSVNAWSHRGVLVPTEKGESIDIQVNGTSVSMSRLPVAVRRRAVSYSPMAVQRMLSTRILDHEREEKKEGVYKKKPKSAAEWASKYTGLTMRRVVGGLADLGYIEIGEKEIVNTDLGKVHGVFVEEGCVYAKSFSTEMCIASYTSTGADLPEREVEKLTLAERISKLLIMYEEFESLTALTPEDRADQQAKMRILSYEIDRLQEELNRANGMI